MGQPSSAQAMCALQLVCEGLLMRRLILKSFQSPGDIVMLTAAVRDLHRAHPGQFQTDVRTSADGLWLHNPNLVPLKEGEAGVETLDMHYPLIHQSNQRPYHFIHGYVQFLEQKLPSLPKRSRRQTWSTWPMSTVGRERNRFHKRLRRGAQQRR